MPSDDIKPTQPSDTVISSHKRLRSGSREAEAEAEAAPSGDSSSDEEPTASGGKINVSKIKTHDPNAYTRLQYTKKYIKYLMVSDDTYGPYPSDTTDPIARGYNELAKTAHPQEPIGTFINNLKVKFMN